MVVDAVVALEFEIVVRHDVEDDPVLWRIVRIFWIWRLCVSPPEMGQKSLVRLERPEAALLKTKGAAIGPFSFLDLKVILAKTGLEILAWNFTG